MCRVWGEGVRVEGFEEYGISVRTATVRDVRATDMAPTNTKVGVQSERSEGVCRVREVRGVQSERSEGVCRVREVKGRAE